MINNVINLTKILKDVNDCSTAIMLSSRINTKIARPTISKIFSEDTIYLAFIYFCKFKTAVPINKAYLSVCNSKLDISEKDKDNNTEMRGRFAAFLLGHCAAGRLPSPTTQS